MPDSDCKFDDVPDETTCFTAETHVHFFRETFHVFGLEFQSWCKCLIGDNASVNLRIAQLCKRPHVGCASHKLNLEVQKMVKDTPQLSKTIESIHHIMRTVKSKLRYSAALRNRTELRPVLQNSTRWSGMYCMLARYGRNKAELENILECDAENGELINDTGLGTKAARYQKMLGVLDVATKELQVRGLTLAGCYEILDSLTDAVREERVCRSSPLFCCKLSTQYISNNSSVVKYPVFERANSENSNWKRGKFRGE